MHSKYIGVSENKAELDLIIKSKQIGACNINYITCNFVKT